MGEIRIGVLSMSLDQAEYQIGIAEVLVCRKYTLTLATFW
jgi:hypothetical protein